MDDNNATIQQETTSLNEEGKEDLMESNFPNSNRSSNMFLVIGIISILFIAGIVYYIVKNRASENIPEQPAPTVQTTEPSPTTPSKPVSSKEVDEVVMANNKFALNLYSEYKKDSGNIFFSPYSISTAFAMVYEGAKGKTAEEIQKLFNYPTNSNLRRQSFSAIYNDLNSPNAKYKLSVANALWAQKDYKFLNEYMDTLKNYYMAQATNLDFVNATEESRLTINKWVETKTNDKIKDLFSAGSLESSTKLVLTNAIYFKGTWTVQFDKNRTTNKDFKVTPTNIVKVPTMIKTDENSKFKYLETDTLQALEVPYEGDKLSMLILLPKSNDIKPIENSLSEKKLSEIKGKLEETRVDVYIPKFTFDTKYFMTDTLSKMGMPTAFTMDADLSGMDGSKMLYISKVIHQAFVDVNEEGTEAAAATGIAVGLKMAIKEIPTFIADHPFIFIIQDKKSGNILFLGRVSNPVK